MNIKIKKRKGTIIGLILLFSMISFVDFQTTTVESETFDPFTETFTTTDYMDIANTNVSGWGDGSIYNTNQKPIQIGSIGSGFIGSPAEVYVHGDHAILGTTDSIETVGITDPTNPISNDSITFTSPVMSICVDNDYAYLASYNDGLTIVDITDPNNLAVFTPYTPASGHGYDVAISGDYAYLARNDVDLSYYGIHILDIADPASIGWSTGWTFETNALVNDIEIKANFAYVGNGSSMLVLDITDPINPILHSEYTSLSSVNDIFIYGEYAFIADQSGLVVLDITYPISPTLIGAFGDLELTKVIVDGTYAYVVDYDGDVYVLDISDFSNIGIIASYDYAGGANRASSIYLDGCYLYVAALASGMDVLQVCNNIQPTSVDHFPVNPGIDRAITTQGNLAYVVGDYFGGLKFFGTLRIYDISDPTSTVLLGEINHPPGLLDFGHVFYDVEIVGSFALVVGTYMTWSAGWIFKMAFYAFDITDPTNPTFFGAQVIPLPLEFYIWWEIAHFDIEISGDYMYITCGSEGVVIYDLSDFSYVTRYDDSIYAHDIYVEGDIGYIAGGASGFQIIDLSNPSTPSKIYTFDTPGEATKLWIVGDLAYVADGGSGIHIFDIQNPSLPVLLGSFDTSDYANSVFVSGDTAFVSDAASGLIVFDVTDPTNPQDLYYYSTIGILQDIVVAGDYAFLVELVNDFSVLEVRKNKAKQFTDLNQAQSTTFFSGESTSSLSHATLTSVSSVPAGSSISYFLSADNGLNWEAVTPNVQHDFTLEGRDLKWKAILTTNDFIVTPTISSITISYTTALVSPELVSPSDGYTTDDKTPKFTWSEVEGAHEYKFQLDDSTTFASPILDITLPSSLTFYTVEIQLSVDTYYWRVAAIDNGSEVGYYSQSRSIIIELDISAPVINHPNDFSYLQGTTGHNITWQASDTFKSSYNITKDGALEIENVWTQEEIVISVDGLTPGVYTYVCNVYDQFTQFSSDTVLVTVSVTQPPIIDNAEDFSYEEGTTGYNITWNPSDNNPDWYNITRNGALIEDEIWDGSNIMISVDGLSIGTYTYICTVYDQHGNYVSDSVIVDVIAQIVPTINHPLDFEYESGDTGNTITWYPYDNNPFSFEVEVDGEPLEAGYWTGDEVTVNVDNLNVGVHTIVCTVFDIHDNTAEDTVIVTVVDTTNPTINHPSDISYTFEDTGNSFTWQPRDNNPQSYVLTLDGEVIESDSWDGGDITVSVDGLAVGTHIYLILITDASGNSASDSVAVTVSEIVTTPTPTPTPTDEEPMSMLFVILSFIAISSLIYHRKKR